MPKIHYFQRYSSMENSVTNNTLQLIARIYAYSTTQASRLLTELIEEQIEIGIEINQQVREGRSVPDGTIIQRPFKVLIESKVNAHVNVDQLLKHAESFSIDGHKILLLITTHPIAAEENRIKKEIANKSPGVVFKNITYEAICKAASALFLEYEFEMRALVDDYVEFCNDAGLFDQSRFLMRIVPCGASLEINRKNGIYFHPSDRGYTRHSYVGIYKGKRVQLLWKIDSVFDAVVEDGQIVNKTLVEGRDTDDYDDKIIRIVADAAVECGWDIATGNRFFCGKPVETNYVKSSYGGIQGARFVNLQEVIENFCDDASAIAEELKTKEWS